METISKLYSRSKSKCDGEVLYYTVRFFYWWLCLVCCLRIIAAGDYHCRPHNSDSSSEKEKKLLKILDPLKGYKFIAATAEYKFYLSICGPVDEKNKDVGLIQQEIKSDKNYSLGQYNDVEIAGGTDWVFLTYYSGEPYDTHCQSQNRTSRIMVICDPTKMINDLRYVEERKMNVSDNCFYLFELNSNVTCDAIWEPKGLPHNLSSGSVFCVIFFTAAGIYLLLGFLYQRIVVGAKGLEQMPNYAFWRSFGNLQADGCDYVCRCGPRQESQAYRGIDDRIRDEERDDQLLN